MKTIICIALGLISFQGLATEKFSCDYSVGNIRSGALENITPLGRASVDVDTNSFKAIRPDGTYLVSPKLSKKNEQLLFADDKSKVYGANVKNTDFAISDRISQKTEQWTSCASNKDVINDENWITTNQVDPMTDHVKARASIKAKELPGKSLEFSCESGSKTIFMSLIAVDDIITDELITYRIDKSQANTIPVQVIRNSNGSAGLTHVNSKMLNQMEAGSSLLVRYGEYNRGGVTLTFGLRGLKDALADIRQQCRI